MTIKTFKSSHNYLHDMEVDTHPDGSVRFSVDADYFVGFCVSPSDAPALALAILEAAGVVPVQRDYESYDDGTPAHLQAVAYFLKQHNEAQERTTAEARERAELEAEALELCNEFIEDMGYDRVDSWDGSVPSKKEAWLAVARRARELAKEATK